jgi:protein-disulfide isomerase
MLAAAPISTGVGADSLPGRFDPGAAAPALGVDNAPMVVVEFFDYRCSHCANHARTIFPEIESRFIDTGQVRYVLVEAIPTGQQGERDAAAARCAGDTGHYMDARDYLFGERSFPRKRPLDLDDFADALGLDTGALLLCVETGRHLPAVRNAVAKARAHRVEATPTFFFGYPVDRQTALTVERHVVGEVSLDQFAGIVEQLLKSKRDAKARSRVDR